jgi:hypothetical protein
VFFWLTSRRWLLYRAAPADYAEQDGNNGNYQQGMNDAAREEASKKAYCPNNYKDDGDNVQQVAHDEEV